MDSPFTKYVKTVHDSLETQLAVMGLLNAGRTNAITAVQSIRELYSTASLETLNSSTARLLFHRSVPEYAGMIDKGNLCVAPSATNPLAFEFHFYNVGQEQCKRMMQLISKFATRAMVNNRYGTSRDCVVDKEMLMRADQPRNYIVFTYLK